MLFLLVQPMHITLDDEHLDWPIVLPNIEGSWSFKALNIPRIIQLSLNLKIILSIQPILMHAFHKPCTIDPVHAGEILTDCL